MLCESQCAAINSVCVSMCVLLTFISQLFVEAAVAVAVPHHLQASWIARYYIRHYHFLETLMYYVCAYTSKYSAAEKHHEQLWILPTHWSTRAPYIIHLITFLGRELILAVLNNYGNTHSHIKDSPQQLQAKSAFPFGWEIYLPN